MKLIKKDKPTTIVLNGGRIMNVVEESLSIKLEGADEIDVDVLAHVLNNTVKTFKELSDDGMEEGNARRFVVKDVTKGSFILEIIEYIVSDPVQSLISVGTVVGAFVAILDLKKHLFGEKPQEIERQGQNVIIKNSKGNDITINQFVFDKYTNNDEIDDAINKVLIASSTGTGRKGLTIKTNNGEVVKFNEEESVNLAKKVDLIAFVPEIKEDVYYPAQIRLASSDFEGNQLWNFYFMGRKYKGKMEDSDFINKLANGEISVNGQTVLNVELVCRYKLDQEGNLMLSSKPKYYIRKVH